MTIVGVNIKNIINYSVFRKSAMAKQRRFLGGVYRYLTIPSESVSCVRLVWFSDIN